MSSGKATRSGMNPMFRRPAIGRRARSWPATRTSPSSHPAIPARQVIRLLLPAPLGPSRPVTPGRSAKLTSRTAFHDP